MATMRRQVDKGRPKQTEGVLKKGQLKNILTRRSCMNVLIRIDEAKDRVRIVGSGHLCNLPIPMGNWREVYVIRYFFYTIFVQLLRSEQTRKVSDYNSINCHLFLANQQSELFTGDYKASIELGAVKQFRLFTLSRAVSLVHTGC